MAAAGVAAVAVLAAVVSAVAETWWGVYAPALLITKLPFPVNCATFALATGRSPFVPYLDASAMRLPRMAEFLRPGDVVISSGIKAGTTWTRMMLQQIRRRGVVDFVDLTDVLPFMEFPHYPTQTWRERLAFYQRQWDSEPPGTKRVVATHARPELLPGVKYVVTFRNPHEIRESYFAFFNSMSEDMRELWGWCPPAPVTEDRFNEMWFSHLAHPIVARHILAWWPLRHDPRVMFQHYSDMTKDPNATLARIAKHIGVELTPEELANATAHSGFAFMKQHADMFDGSPNGLPRHYTSRGILKPGFRYYNPEALTRKGKAGAAKKDGFFERYAKLLEEQVPDPVARSWLLGGGPVS